MKLSIAISGPAGAGVLSAGMLIGKSMAQKGYDVVGDKEYQSIIKGGNNTFINYISDEGKYISKQIDYFIYMDEYALAFNQKAYDIKNAIILPGDVKINKNIFAIGIIANLVCASKKDFEGMLKDKFGKKTFFPGILKAFEDGYEFAKESVIPAKAGIYKKSQALSMDSHFHGNDKIPQKGQLQIHDLCKFKAKPKKFMFGNQLIAQGASDAGLGYFSFYPMTPSTTISSELYKIKEKGDNKELVIFQGENEIAVSISMLGASFTGKSAMCATSGGGFALMVESISFSYIAEIGAVYILSQRDGPSTGSPTFMAQGDISFALNPSFGDIHPIVIYPSSIEEGYNLIGKALYRSQKYQNPIIFLLDKQFSECYYSVDEELLKKEPRHSELVSESLYKAQQSLIDPETSSGGHGISSEGQNYKRYELTKDGISPYMIPGTKDGEFITSSYEHDEYGASTEDLEIKKKMTDKRVKKMETFVKEEFNKDFQGYEIINPKAKKFFISFGINNIVLRDYVTKNKDWGIILVKVLKPLDPRLIKFLSENKDNIEKLVFVEYNESGQFEEYIRTKAKLFNNGRDEKIDHIRKYNLYPFFGEDIEEALL